MDFAKAVVRDIIIYTLPFIAVRVALYPIVNINSKMQRQYRKVEEEANLKDKYQKYQNFPLKEKYHCLKEIVSVAGVKGVYEKCENYLVPFTVARISEGIVYFTFMRYCLDVLKLEDPLYLLTGLAFFFVSLVGSFCLKLFGDVMRERKSFKSTMAHLSLSNTTFWKQYEVELGYYHAYSLIQGYFQLFTFWYFKPSFVMEIVLFALSKMFATITCQPLAILAQWSCEHDYDHVKLLQQIAKRDGKLGLYAGSKDVLLNEVIFALILIPGIHIVSSLI